MPDRGGGHRGHYIQRPRKERASLIGFCLPTVYSVIEEENHVCH